MFLYGMFWCYKNCTSTRHEYRNIIFLEASPQRGEILIENNGEFVSPRGGAILIV